ncbi:hypothetical protein [Saccharothrix luteola]|uniref:hypothetical protein n=1 Tax=Saccharothrix luteola TaxID=2893018 RepID=UPI001E596E83|nr:hypothetical protein [Saccharothrix luteola]MCC8247098.1 hypothetical protein [Saccharothrix luteola]MCC8249861.1 hypothetical protein [Saccharothrix luteola]
MWAFREADARGADTVDVGGSPTTAADLTAVADLLAQLDAYRRRGADYEAERFAGLLTELHARTTANGPRAEVLGPDEPAETPLRKVRLTALGARPRSESTADVYFASGDVVLVQHATPLRAAQHLATSNVVSESATRSASRAVTVKTNRVAKTSLTPVGTAWDDLPRALVVDDYAAAAERLAELPPRQVRARVEAEPVRAVRVAEVSDLAYDPAAQRLTATLHDSTGASCVLEAAHRAVAPRSLDALAAALRAGPTTITGSVRRHRGTLVVDPLAVHTRAGVVVVDLATDTTPQPLPPGVTTADPLSASVGGALTVLADASHRGLGHLTDSLLARVREAGAHLHGTGLRAAAALVTAFADTPSATTWFKAHLRLLVTADAR